MPKIYDSRDLQKEPQEFKEPPEVEVRGVAPPVLRNDDGSIFVSIVSYRDGERCAATIKSIFENAKRPEKVVVGLVEQNNYEDAYCLDEYCRSYGALVFEKQKTGTEVSKIVRNEKEEVKCPYLPQIRLLATNDVAARGPMYARSLMRKLLGNEEFCLQLDAHSTMAQHWDVGLTSEWQSTNNEFAVLSTIPMDFAMMAEKKTFVPRQCVIRMQDNGVPNYEVEPDAYVEGHSRPLLSHAWSAALSFAKCHLEETVPYDPFSFYAMPVEQFVRYARMWTRGYDTYTPTKNYVYHDYGEQKNGHGDKEWFKKFQKNRFRVKAIDRAKMVLEIPSLSEESDTPEADRANLGLYGLGQRRTLDKMKEFMNFSIDKDHGNNLERGSGCVEGHSIVKYDATISPLANLHHEGATKLDPYPIFPLRTEPVFSAHDVNTVELAKHLPDRLDTDHLEIALDENESPEVVEAKDAAAKHGLSTSKLQHLAAGLHHDPVAAVGPELLEQSSLPPPSVLFVLWIFGLMIWYFLFAVKQNAIAKMGDDDKSWLSKAKSSAISATKVSATTSTSSGRKTKLVKDV
ncbi:hypothetical protein ACA910_016495 [Epithemia clementina (nom. ined.)]